MEVNMLGQVLVRSAWLLLAKLNTSQGLKDSKLLFHTAMPINIYPLAERYKQAHNALLFPISFFQNNPTWKEVFLGSLQHTVVTCTGAPPSVFVALFKRHWAEQWKLGIKMYVCSAQTLQETSWVTCREICWRRGEWDVEEWQEGEGSSSTHIQEFPPFSRLLE